MSALDAMGGQGSNFNWQNALLNVSGSTSNPTLDQGVYSNWQDLVNAAQAIPGTGGPSGEQTSDAGVAGSNMPPLYTIPGYGGEWTYDPGAGDQGGYMQYLGGDASAPSGNYVGDIESTSGGGINAFVRNNSDDWFTRAAGVVVPALVGSVIGAAGGAILGPAISGATGVSASTGSSLGSLAVNQAAGAYMNNVGGGNQVNPINTNPGDVNYTGGGAGGSVSTGGLGTSSGAGGASNGGISQGTMITGGLGGAALSNMGALSKMSTGSGGSTSAGSSGTNADGTVPISDVAQVPYAQAKQIRMPDINSYSLANSIDGSTMGGGYAAWKASQNQ